MHYEGIFKEKSQDIIRYMDDNGIDKAIINTLNTQASLSRFNSMDLGEIVRSAKEGTLELFKDFREKGQPDHAQIERLIGKYPERAYAFFWYNPCDPSDPEQQKGLSLVEQKLERGFKGIKLHMAMTPCEIDRLHPIAELLNERRLPLYIHFNSGLFGLKRTDPFEIAELAKKYPKMPLIVGHAAYTMEFAIELSFAALSAKNIYFETSCSIPYGIITFLKLFGPRRVIFGSDSPPAGPFELEFAKINGLNVNEHHKKKIFYDNISRLIKEKR